MQLIDQEIESYAFQVTQPEPDYLKNLFDRTYAEMNYPDMITGRIEGRLLKFIVQMLQPRLVLEIGTFTGYSALWMAEGLPDEGRIITCDIDPNAQRIAQAAFDASPCRDKIELRMGPALDTVRQLNETIDMSFIDADKENYPAYYEEVLLRTRPGGVIIIDNALWYGRVLDPQDTDSRAVASLNEVILKDNRVENVMLTVRDGIQLVRKK